MFDEFIQELAQAYDEAADWSYRPGIASMWRELADDSAERAGGIRLLLDVSETDDPEPYLSATAMCHHIAEGRFIVSRAHSEHPVWSVAQNVDFRICHDVLGHYAASVAAGWAPRRSGARVAGFDWAGENAACAAHFRLLHSQDARTALFSECLMQTAWAIENGFEGISQKCVQSETALARVTGDHDLFDEYKRVVAEGKIR